MPGLSVTGTAGSAFTITRTSTNNSATVATTQAYTVQVKDAYGNPVQGVQVNFLKTAGSTNASVTPANQTTDANGQAPATITLGNLTSVTNTYTATVNGTAITNTLSVTGIAGTPTQFTPVVTPATTAAAGMMQTWTLLVKDVFNNNVSGQVVDFTKTAGTGSIPASAVTGANGQVTVTVSNGVAVETNSYSAQVHGTALTRSISVDIQPYSTSVKITSPTVGVFAYQVTLHYDPNVLHLVDTSAFTGGNGTGFSGFTSGVTADNIASADATGTITFNSFETVGPNTGTFIVAGLVFTPVGGSGTVNLTTPAIDITDIGGFPIPNATLTLTVTTMIVP